jgi:hypothetical protein
MENIMSLRLKTTDENVVLNYSAGVPAMGGPK